MHVFMVSITIFVMLSPFLPIMLFMLPIMLVLWSNVNNLYVEFLLLECSIRVITIGEYI